MITEIFKYKSSDNIFDHLIHQNEQETLLMAHVHNAYEIIFFLRGDATFVIEHKKYQLKKNDIIFVRPQKYHYLELNSSNEYERYHVRFSSTLLEMDINKIIPDEIEVLNCNNNIIQQNFKKLDYYSSHLDEKSFWDIGICLLKETLYNLGLLREDVTAYDLVSPLLSQALKYIDNNLFTIQNITEISQSLYITEPYLFKIFKKQLKISPKKYITEKRLMEAEKRIRLGEKPTEIYRLCGFKTYPAFYKRYMDCFGFAPSETPLI